MDYSVLERSSLFRGIPVDDIHELLRKTRHQIRCFEKGELIFRLMEKAAQIGIILEGRVEAQKSFPNGSQVNVSVRGPGEMIGPAAVFSDRGRYPCDIAALGQVRIMIFYKEDLMGLMRRDVRILENFTREVASAVYMLQQRLELLSYHGIAQKAAFWLLLRARQGESRRVKIPGSFSKWAMLMNVSRPSLHRELKKLEAQGIISLEPPEIRILKPHALEEVLST